MMNLSELTEIQNLNIKLLKIVNRNLNQIKNDEFHSNLFQHYKIIYEFWSVTPELLFSYYTENKMGQNIQNWNNEIFELYDKNFLDSGFQLSSIDEILLRILMCTTYLNQYEDIEFKSNLFDFADFLERRLVTLSNR